MADDRNEETPQSSSATEADVAAGLGSSTTTTPAATTPAATTPAATTPADKDNDEEVGRVDDEPAEASRVSPYSISAFALSLLALFQAPQNLLTAQVQRSQFLRFVLPSLVIPVGAALVSLWLAGRGEEEVYVSDGRVGGVGFFKAARMIATGVLLITALAVILVLFLSEQAQDGGMPMG